MNQYRKRVLTCSVFLLGMSALIFLVTREAKEDKIRRDIAQIITVSSCSSATDRDFARNLASYIQINNLPWQRHDDVYKNYPLYIDKITIPQSYQGKCRIKAFSPPAPTGDANRERSQQREEETNELLERING